MPPAITIHSVAHARLVLARAAALDRPITLLSAAAAAVFAGPAWWRALIEACGTTQPDLLDCADAPGRALEAVALGCRWLILRPCPAWPSVAERAARSGTLMRPDRPASLDLADWADRAALGRIDAWLEVG